MTYKKKFNALVSVICALLIIYIAGIIFSPQRRDTRAASFVWLDQKLTERISRISLSYNEQNFEFLKNGNQWSVLYEGNEYPGKKFRIEDFISIITEKGQWSLRSSDASTHNRFGLDTDAASRITIYGENALLLDLLLGFTDDAGQIYARKYGENEVRSGENNFYFYLSGHVSSWYNLRLFPENEEGYEPDNVQKLSVYTNEGIQIFSQINRFWNLSVSDHITGFAPLNVSQIAVENYLRNILTSEGNDYININYLPFIDFNDRRIVIEFGNGKTVTVGFSEPDEDDRCLAHIEGGNFIFSIPSWVSARIFRNASGFEMQ